MNKWILYGAVLLMSACFAGGLVLSSISANISAGSQSIAQREMAMLATQIYRGENTQNTLLTVLIIVMAVALIASNIFWWVQVRRTTHPNQLREGIVQVRQHTRRLPEKQVTERDLLRAAIELAAHSQQPEEPIIDPPRPARNKPTRSFFG